MSSIAQENMLTNTNTSTTTTTSNKRKEPPASSSSDLAEPPTKVAAKVSPEQAPSPYKLRQEAYKRFCDESQVIFTVSDPLQKLSENREEELFGGVSNEDAIQEMNKEKRQDILDQLSPEEVENGEKIILLPISVYNKHLDLERSLMRADTRWNDESEEKRDVVFYMLDTHSTWCMYPLIDEMLRSAQRAVNKAQKAFLGSNVAKDAFATAFPAILAIHNVDHWRLDTEDEEETFKIAKKVIKLIKDLLWFEDSELGFCDPFSRQGLLCLFDDMYKDWLGADTKMSYKVPSNGQGLGRSQAQPKARPKASTAGALLTDTAPAVTAGTAAASTTPSNTGAIEAYLNAAVPRLAERTVTCVQIRVFHEFKETTVVLSGATHLKKLNEICAYVTGNSDAVSYHPQKGKCLPGSRLELVMGNETMWITDKAGMKKAPGLAALDKGLKIVQIFQGCATSNSSGIVYDDPEIAKTVSLFWVSPDGQRYQIQVQAIVPNKAVGGKPVAMPRMVHPDCNNARVRNDFGVYVWQSNEILLADRALPTFITFIQTSKAEMRRFGMGAMARPLCNPDGTCDCRLSFI